MTTTDAPPDWSTLAAELACPLCGYNLRGLAEPRCPECGFAFTWAELLDGKRDRHPWLFEHAPPGRRLRAFWTTYWRTCRPRRFWREVLPTHPVRAGALISYWIVTVLLMGGVIVGPLVVLAGRTGLIDYRSRAYYTSVSRQPGTFGHTHGGSFAFKPTAAQLDGWYPPVPSLAFARQVADAYLRQTGGAMVAIIVVAAAWPWVTAATLMLFRASMRQAKVNGGHLLRASIYSCDLGMLLTAITVAVYWLHDVRTIGQLRGHDVVELAAILAFVTAAGCAVVTTYRLTFACSRYLRFHLPLATVVATQVIALLVLLVVAVRVDMGW
jgi:hypothetical protein